MAIIVQRHYDIKRSCANVGSKFAAIRVDQNVQIRLEPRCLPRRFRRQLRER
jgi:hypothetical protein